MALLLFELFKFVPPPKCNLFVSADFTNAFLSFGRVLYSRIKFHLFILISVYSNLNKNVIILAFDLIYGFFI